MANAPTYDWTQFRLGVFVRSRPDDLFSMWTTAEGLCRWFLRSAAFAPSDGPPSDRKAGDLPVFDTLPPRLEAEICQANDRYQWEWYYNGGVIGEEWIRDVRPPTRLVFGFGDGMEIEVTLRKQGVHCEVDLRQHNIPTSPAGRWNMHMGCRSAWTFFLANLKSVAEGGLDLRETEYARTRMLHLINM